MVERVNILTSVFAAELERGLLVGPDTDPDLALVGVPATALAGDCRISSEVMGTDELDFATRLGVTLHTIPWSAI